MRRGGRGVWVGALGLVVWCVWGCDDGGGGGEGSQDTAIDVAVDGEDGTGSLDVDGLEDVGVAPRIESLTVMPLPLARGGTAVAVVVVEAQDAGELTYAWSASGGFEVAAGEAGSATVTAPDEAFAVGTLTVAVTDSRGGDVATVALETSGNRAPTIVSLTATPEGVLAPGGLAELAVVVEDADGDLVTVTWAIDAAQWVLDATGEAVTVLAPNAYGAAATVTVRAEDGQGGEASAQLTLSTQGCADTERVDCDGDASNGCEARESGIGPTCAAPSCLAVRESDPEATDGVYYLRHGERTVEAYCDMTTEGGGWVLLGTISGADEHRWTQSHGPWSDSSTFGAASMPWLDYKSELWATLELTDQALMLQRRYDEAARASTVIEGRCLQGRQTLAQVFTVFDTSVACPPDALHVLHSESTGLAGERFREGVGAEGLGSPTTNGLCWATRDTAVNTFSGHLGWNAEAGATTCEIGTHSGGVGVFEHATNQYTDADITGTAWLYGTDYAKTAVSIFARPRLSVVGSGTVADPRRWSNHGAARSCAEYARPPEWLAEVEGALTDGIYLIDVDGASGPLPQTAVFCDMTTDGGGWTAIVANGEVAQAETLDASDCYPLVTDDPAAGCGDPTDVLGDFTLSGAVQAGLVWSQMLGISYGGAGYGEKLGYFGIDFGSPQSTRAERNGGTPLDPAGLVTEHGVIACTNTAGLRIVHYGMGGTYVTNASYLAYQRGTVFGHNSASSMAQSTRRTLGFTDRGDHSGAGGTSSVYGLDDYQDGWSCGDTWEPKALRGARLMLLVR